MPSVSTPYYHNNLAEYLELAFGTSSYKPSEVVLKRLEMKENRFQAIYLKRAKVSLAEAIKLEEVFGITPKTLIRESEDLKKDLFNNVQLNTLKNLNLFAWILLIS